MDPADEEFKAIMKNTRRKLEVPTPAAMTCRSQREEYILPCSVSENVRQNTHASLKPTNLRVKVWKGLFIKVMKIILQGEEFIEPLQSCAQIDSYPSSNENTRRKCSSG